MVDNDTLWTNYIINGAIQVRVHGNTEVFQGLFSGNTINFHCHFQSFPGNFDSNTVVSHVLPVPFSARHVRFVVQEWNDHPDMRVEVYGCI